MPTEFKQVKIVLPLLLDDSNVSRTRPTVSSVRQENVPGQAPSSVKEQKNIEPISSKHKRRRSDILTAWKLDS